MSRALKTRFRIKETGNEPPRPFVFLRKWRAVEFLSVWDPAILTSHKEGSRYFDRIFNAGFVLNSSRVLSLSVLIPSFKRPGRTLYPSELTRGSSALIVMAGWDPGQLNLIRMEATLLSRAGLPVLSEILARKRLPRRSTFLKQTEKPLHYWEIRHDDDSTVERRGAAHAISQRDTVKVLLRTMDAIATLARAHPSKPIGEVILGVRRGTVRGLKVETYST